MIKYKEIMEITTNFQGEKAASSEISQDFRRNQYDRTA
jgi:hypothetical protein